MPSRRLLLQVALLVCLLIAGLLYLSGSSNKGHTQADGAQEPAPRVVTDVVGREVVISGRVSNTASLLIPSYEKLALLGQADKLRMTMRLRWPWAHKLFPSLGNAVHLPPGLATNPSIEDMVSNHVDLIFFWNRPEIIERMRKADIPVLVTQTSDLNAQNSLEGFLSYRKKEMLLHGNVFGPQAQRRAQEWVDYFEAKVAFVYEKTRHIPAAQRPRVYYVRGPDALMTHGKYTYTWWDITIAGGDPVTTGQTKEVIEQVPVESLIALNPEVIFMGWLDNTDLILKDSRWASLSAVRNGKVYVNPSGVYNWDFGNEAPLLILYFAKVLHPDLFQDVDIAAETKKFYAKFFDYHLSDDETRRILAHLPPADAMN